MIFARRVFLVAGYLGVLAVLPMYFLERMIGRVQPPEINHPEYFYGFVGVCLAWQVGFVIIGRDPIRFRPLMIAAILEKATFAFGCLILVGSGRSPAAILGPAAVDLILGVLFVVSFAKTAPKN